MKNINRVLTVCLIMGTAALFAACTQSYEPQKTYYTITPIGNNSGAITATPSSQEAGQTVTITAMPPSAHKVKIFTVTKLSDSTEISPLNPVAGDENARTFTMPASNVSVAVEFISTADPPHNVTVTHDPPGGTLTPPLPLTEYAEMPIVFNVTPPPSYQLAAVTVNGDSSGVIINGNNVRFDMPDRDADILITYTQIQGTAWEVKIKTMYPGALALPTTPEIDGASGHYPGIDPALTANNVVRFTGATQAGGGNATPNIRYRINTDTVDLDDYEAILVVTTISELSNTTSQRINLVFRDHFWDMSGTYNPLNFYPTDGTGFPNSEAGLFFLGKSGAAYTTFANTVKGIASANDRGFNIQNNADNADRRGAFTLTIEAIMLLPKRSAGVMAGYGPSQDGNEYILDPTLITNSRATSESVPVFDWMVLSTASHARLNLGALSPAISNAASVYTKLVIDFTFLYSNRIGGATVAEQYIALSKADHDRNSSDEIARSAAVDRTLTYAAAPTPLEISLTGANGSVSNMLELVCVDAGRICIKINSMKLVK